MARGREHGLAGLEIEVKSDVFDEMRGLTHRLLEVQKDAVISAPVFPVFSKDPSLCGGCK